MTLSKDTSIKISIAGLLAMLLWMSGASWKVFGYVQMIAANTVAIQSVAKSLAVGRVVDEMGLLKRERRSLKRELRKEPDNDQIMEQIDDITDELDMLEIRLKCLIDGKHKVCA